MEILFNMEGGDYLSENSIQHNKKIPLGKLLITKPLGFKTGGVKLASSVPWCAGSNRSIGQIYFFP